MRALPTVSAERGYDDIVPLRQSFLREMCADVLHDILVGDGSSRHVIYLVYQVALHVVASQCLHYTITPTIARIWWNNSICRVQTSEEKEYYSLRFSSTVAFTFSGWVFLKHVKCKITFNFDTFLRRLNEFFL